MKDKKVTDIASVEERILREKVATQFLKRPNSNTIMKKSLARCLATLPMISLLLLNFSQKAEAQVLSEETSTTLQICNTIMNMHDADPENPELSMGRRECDLRAYYVQLCVAYPGAAYAPCWNANYPRPIELDNNDLITIIQNNQ